MCNCKRYSNQHSKMWITSTVMWSIIVINMVLNTLVCVADDNAQTQQQPHNVQVANADDIADLTIPNGVQNVYLSFTETGQVLNSGAFSDSMESLLALTLDVVHVDSIEAGAFSALRQLKNLTFVKSDGDQLSSYTVVGSDTFQGLRDLKILDLSSLQLQHLHSGCFNGLDNLQRLTLNNNNMEGVFGAAPDVLSTLPSLQVLDLSGNRLTHISTTLLQANTQLQDVDLSSNQIVSIDADTFTHLTNLTRLILSDNSLGMFDLSFAPSSTLQTLKVENNRLSNITTNTFPAPMPALQHLSMAHNDISNVEPASFEHTTGLLTLNLIYNQIEQLEDDTFSGLQTLRSLDLNDNHLNAISKDAFRPLDNLHTLELQNNRITHLPDEVFDNLVHLVLLSLMNNQLNELPANLRTKNLEILQMTLDNNPWDCGCGIAWLLDDVHYDKVVQPEECICASPPALQNKSFQDLMTANSLMHCVPDVTTATNDNSTLGGEAQPVSSEVEPWKIRVIIAVVIILAVLIIVIVVVWLTCQYRRASWNPPQGSDKDSEQPAVDISDRNRLLLMARHKHQKYTLDPETGHVEVFTEEEIKRARSIQKQAKKQQKQEGKLQEVRKEDEEEVVGAVGGFEPRPHNDYDNKAYHNSTSSTIQSDTVDGAGIGGGAIEMDHLSRSREALESVSSQKRLLSTGDDGMSDVDDAFTRSDVSVHQPFDVENYKVHVDAITTETNVDTMTDEQHSDNKLDAVDDDATPVPSPRRKSSVSMEHNSDSMYGTNTDSDSHRDSMSTNGADHLDAAAHQQHSDYSSRASDSDSNSDSNDNKDSSSSSSSSSSSNNSSGRSTPVAQTEIKTDYNDNHDIVHCQDSVEQVSVH